MKRVVAVYYPEVLDPCLCILYMCGTKHTHNQERGEELKQGPRIGGGHVGVGR